MCLRNTYIHMLHMCVCALNIMRRIYHVHLPFPQIIKFIAYTVYFSCISTRCYCFFFIVVVVAVAFCIFSELQQEKRPTAKSKQQ